MYDVRKVLRFVVRRKVTSGNVMGQPVRQGAWVFDPQDAVTLLLGLRGEAFPFEYALTSYLLFAWALRPTTAQKRAEGDDESKVQAANTRKLRNSKVQAANTRKLRNIARNLGAIVTFTKIKETEKDRLPRRRRLKSPIELVLQIVSDWYRSFYQSFVERVGGLSAPFVWPRSITARREDIKNAWDNTLLVRDIVAYLSRMQQFD